LGGVGRHAGRQAGRKAGRQDRKGRWESHAPVHITNSDRAK